MFESGWILYVLLAALLYLFWVKARAMSFDDLLDQSAREHHEVMRVIARYPHGGTWRQHKQWMKQEEEKPRRRARRC
jgi:hypothetical protein